MTALKRELVLDDHNGVQIVAEQEFHAYPILK